MTAEPVADCSQTVAARFFDPANVDDMAAALRDVALNPELRSRLRAEGFAQAQNFSWEKSARRLVEVLREAGA